LPKCPVAYPALFAKATTEGIVALNDPPLLSSNTSATQSRSGIRPDIIVAREGEQIAPPEWKLSITNELDKELSLFKLGVDAHPPAYCMSPYPKSSAIISTRFGRVVLVGALLGTEVALCVGAFEGREVEGTCDGELVGFVVREGELEGVAVVEGANEGV
jgi:hypothetical protein